MEKRHKTGDDENGRENWRCTLYSIQIGYANTIVQVRIKEIRLLTMKFINMHMHTMYAYNLFLN